MYSFDEVKKVDPEIAQAIVEEQERQNSHIELIASENWVSKAVMAAMGSPLTNKYAEGYPGKRYYGGCQCVDVVENLYRANFERDEEKRIKYQKSAAVSLSLLDFYTDTARRKRAITIHHTAVIAKQLAETKKLLSGWIKSTKRR